MWASSLCTSQMDVYRLFVILLLLVSTACEIKLVRVCLCFLQSTPFSYRKDAPCEKEERSLNQDFQLPRLPRHEISHGIDSPRGNTIFFRITKQAMFDSFKMLEFEQNVLTWNGSNICTCWKKSKHFAVHFFDIKWHLPVELWCLMGGVVWMHCAYSSFVDWSACLKYISNSMRQICSEWAEQCRVKVREQPDIMEDQFQ